LKKERSASCGQNPFIYLNDRFYSHNILTMGETNAPVSTLFICLLYLNK